MSYIKSFLYQKQVKLEYFLAKEKGRFMYAYYDDTPLEHNKYNALRDYTFRSALNIEDSSDDEGVIDFRHYAKWTKLTESNEYFREFEVGEKLFFEDKDYEIINVSHNLDGSINYYIDKFIYEESDSKLKAEEDLIRRKEFLEKREQEERENKTTPVPEPEHIDGLSKKSKVKKMLERFFR